MSETRKLWIEGPCGRIEAMLRVANPARAAAVVAHPHPIHGGTMHNPVVFHTDRELNRAGLTTLRFNFRGVGSSEGIHDEGHGEVEDAHAALAWLRGAAPGVPQLWVGYSFGSFAGFRNLVTRKEADGFIAIGFPVRIYDFTEIAELGIPTAAVQGSEDEFGTPDEVREVLDLAEPPGILKVLPGAGHLFPGRGAEVGYQVVEAARDLLEASA